MVTPISARRLRLFAQCGMVFCATFLLSAGIASVFMIPSNSQAAVTPISCGLPHALSTCLSLVAENVTMDIPLVNASGSYTYAMSSVNVKTNAPEYSLSLSTASADSTSQSMQNHSASDTLAPTAGTPASQSVLSSNTWGFTTAASPTPDAAIWSAVPTTSAPAILVSSSTPNDTDGISTDIYYGVNANHEQTAGIYSATVLYTAMVVPFGAPSITDVSPNYGAASGDTVITITGTNFYDTMPTTGVKVGGADCASFTVNSPTQITCTVPAGTAGARDVTVTTENGTAAKTGGYTYVGAPAITSTSPNIGVVNGNTVTITGTNFTAGGIGAYTVSDDSGYTTCAIQSATSITCPIANIPEGSTGTVTVAITTTGGTATTTFTYSQPYPSPTITAISNSISTAYGTTSGTVTVATDINANCRWSLNNDFNYLIGQGIDFTAGQGTADHSTMATGLVGGLNTIFVRCANANDASRINHYSTTAVTISTTPPGPPEPNPANPTTYGAMQQMGNDDCSTTRGTAFDARNGQTYYVQRVGDQCWMETNLRYDGNGNWNSAWGYRDDRYARSANNNTANTNDDVRPIAMTDISDTYTYPVSQPAIMYPSGGSSDYTNTAANGGFYGVLYNWCAAMGGQVNACNNTSTTGFDTNQSICPAGWRLPRAYYFQLLNNAINSGSTTNDLGLRNNFLAVYSGLYYSELHDQGSYGYYWSSTVGTATVAHTLAFGSNIVAPGTGNADKYNGRAVRCLFDILTPVE